MKTIHICTHIMWWIGSVVNMVRMYVSRSNMFSAKRCNMHLISYGHIFCTLHRECRNSERITLHSTVHFTPIEENKLDKQSEFDDGVFFCWHQLIKCYHRACYVSWKCKKNRFFTLLNLM